MKQPFKRREGAVAESVVIGGSQIAQVGAVSNTDSSTKVLSWVPRWMTDTVTYLPSSSRFEEST